MKLQPMAMKANTMPTFTATITALTVADSDVPLISKRVRMRTMNSAGMFMMPCAPVPISVSKGEWQQEYGILPPHNLFKYSLQAIDTVPAPNAYSSTRAQPITQAMISPIVV